jgi:two-component system, NtrC family, sensor histidine kinase GlrK
VRLSFFSRLVLGYLAVFALVAAVSFYTQRELHRFNEITNSILDGDNAVLDYEKKLTDSLLGQIRYERKFVIVRDQALYTEFLKFKADFDRYLEAMASVADAKTAALLDEVKRDYQRYQDLFSKERMHLSARQTYPQTWYEHEKDKATNAILASLDTVRWEKQQETYGKVKRLAEAGERAGDATVAITLASLAFILALSFVITRSITKPIAILKNKTREIAQGKFDADLQLSSPAEIGQLAGAFNFMCQKLKELEKMKADFFSSMSHELRTPLTSIKEGTGLLLDGVGGTTTAKQQRLLQIIAEESNRLITLVNSLLDLSKMEAGMMNYNFDRTSIAPLVHKVVHEMTPLLEAKEIRLNAEVAPELPSVNIDRERILQVLRNLIGNAIKFTPKAGRINVSAKADGDHVAVSVRDSGPGILGDDLKAIFDKFHQGNGKGRFSANGTGLGLAIAKHVVTSHGGQIWAESYSDQGSTFTFTLPC